MVKMMRIIIIMKQATPQHQIVKLKDHLQQVITTIMSFPQLLVQS